MNYLIKSFVCSMLLCGTTIGSVMANEISSEIQQNTITKLSTLLEEHYVFEDVAKQTTAKLKAEFEAGKFAQYHDAEGFAMALTEWLQTQAKDRHLRVRVNPSSDNVIGAKARFEDSLLKPLNRGASSQGVLEVSMLEGDIGYLQLNSFRGLEDTKAYLDAAMTVLSSAQAIIIDLRKNGGGSPFTVQYLCSYFFDKKLLLNSLYYREEDETRDFYVLDDVSGKKLTDIPLYILTSKRTYSAAEEFSYNMRTRERATLVGETTGGAANPGGMFPVNETFRTFIATGTAINPVTKTNWETVGVEPHVKVAPEQALDKAIALAKEAVNKRWHSKKQQREEGIAKLFKLMSEIQNNAEYSDKQKSHYLTRLSQLFEGLELSRYGYYELAEDELDKHPHLGALLLEVNSQYFPKDEYIYGLWAEALKKNGQLKQAKKILESGIERVESELQKQYLQKELAQLDSKSAL
ncbi:S41 family peptidase [Pseudoalteromonas sp. JBTF-M23]|uniref:S41 family peptidase n=1 Tax=Pseudoalteromonas caenipelagi TaxID=2726988 RepID=A0A849VG53_9GAMM|nr:S41 family peptidase [Pseudoalteromonas caenipelagi]NOU52195.1 S41 family peptidase [Pseudoalteromonas caenipelagi]